MKLLTFVIAEILVFVILFAIFGILCSAQAAQQGCDCRGTTGGVGGLTNPARAHPGERSAAQRGGGKYYYGPRDGDVVDEYQPWPESEMRQFQLP